MAKEVVETHLAHKGADLDAYMNKHWEESWEHFDVNNEGTIDALWTSSLMRYLCRPEKTNIDLD